MIFFLVTSRPPIVDSALEFDLQRLCQSFAETVTNSFLRPHFQIAENGTPTFIFEILNLQQQMRQQYTWVVVKIMVPFWVP